MLRILAAILILALGLWMFLAVRAGARWSGYIQALGAEPGIVVVSTDREGGKYVVNGLRDPLARDPASLLPMHNLETDDVVGRWQLYQALHPSLVLARARQLLGPPAGADLEFNDGVLRAVGSAPVEWIEASARIAPVLPGVTRFDATRPIDEARRTLAASIEAAAPLFVKGTTTFAGGGEQIVRDQITRLHSLDALGRAGNLQFTVELIGQADADGIPEANQPLSEQRAARVLGMLQAQRFERVATRATGIGSRGADPTATEESKQRNRRVSFRVARADGR
jgi:OOP family OmpA-OmpF porin